MKEGDIVSVITMSGEYIGKLVSNRHDCVELADPRIIVNTPEGKMGFAKGICVTGCVNPTSVTIQNYVFMTETNDDIWVLRSEVEAKTSNQASSVSSSSTTNHQQQQNGIMDLKKFIT